MLRNIIIYLLGAIILAMAIATVVEKYCGAAMASTAIYGSWWFAALWTMLAVLALAYIFRVKLQRRPATFLLHISFIVILLGAGVTAIWGSQGVMHLRQGIPTGEYAESDGRVSHLPFTLTLQQFRIDYYPGTDAPMDYVSEIAIDLSNQSEIDDFGAPSVGIEGQVAMNKALTHRGYRFYMSSYDSDMGGSILRVSHDSWGMGITYVGYALLLIACIWFFWDKKSNFRRLWRGGAIAIMFIVGCLGANAVNAPTVPKAQADQLGMLLVEHNQRICPLSTLATDITLKLYGKTSCEGLSANQVLAGWIFYPDAWMNVPTKLSKGNNATRENRERESIQQMLMSGSMLRIFPVELEPGVIAWAAPTDILPQTVPADERIMVRKGLGYLAELAVAKDYSAMSHAIEKIGKWQWQRGGDSPPSHARVCAENLYNRMHWSMPIAIILICLGLVIYFLFLKGILAYVAAIAVCTIFVLLLAFMVGLRGYVAGHWPLTNGFETMQCMALCALVLSLCIFRRYRLAPPFGLLVSGMAMMVAALGDRNPQITPLMPVLASPLLSIHVAIVMIAYALLAIAMLGGITGIYYHLVHRDGEAASIARVNLLMLYPAVFTLALGIFIGAIWANESWGRYWGWDPKETWALITMLIYAFALHGRTYPSLQRPLTINIYCVVAFLSVIITYFGVNFLLGGLHSYA